MTIDSVEELFPASALCILGGVEKYLSIMLIAKTGAWRTGKPE